MPTRYYLLCAALLLLSSNVFAQPEQRDMAKENLILQKLEAIAPGSVTTFKQGTAAMDAGDFAESARLYEEVFKKAPDFDPVMRRLGLSLVLTGRNEEGIGLLEMAVEKNRSPENLISLAQYLAYPGESKKGSRQDMERALVLPKEAARPNLGDEPDYWAMVAQLAVELDRDPEFREATKMLAAKYPDALATHYFGAIVAAMDSDWIKAEDAIKE